MSRETVLSRRGRAPLREHLDADEHRSHASTDDGDRLSLRNLRPRQHPSTESIHSSPAKFAASAEFDRQFNDGTAWATDSEAVATPSGQLVGQSVDSRYLEKSETAARDAATMPFDPISCPSRRVSATRWSDEAYSNTAASSVSDSSGHPTKHSGGSISVDRNHSSKRSRIVYIVFLYI